MPYEWSSPAPDRQRLTLWPHRSLPKRGLVWFVVLTALMLLLPLFAVLGTMVLWGLLPFLALTLWAIIYFIGRSYRDGGLREVMVLTAERVDLTHAFPGKPKLEWTSPTHWVTVHLQASGGPVENYVTLRGNDRTVEIGTFLSPEERADLHDEIQRVLDDMRASRY